MDITIGADPELFVKDREGEWTCLWDTFPGTKQQPEPVPDGAVQVDGLAVEFNINPAHNRQEFVGNISSVLSHLQGMLPEGYTAHPEPSVRFPPKLMKNLPPHVKRLGCEPDFNAYSFRPNREHRLPANTRTCAGHVHVGWTSDQSPEHPRHFTNCANLVKVLDRYLGLPSVLLDEDNVRRANYGAPGTFRPTPYGVEYRTLSPFWLKAPSLIEWVYDNTMLAVNRCFYDIESHRNKYANDIVDTISQGNKEYASHLVSILEVPLPENYGEV